MKPEPTELLGFLPFITDFAEKHLAVRAASCVRACIELQATWHRAPQQSANTDLHHTQACQLQVVAKWGRYPHRNAQLGRPSTEAEQKGLQDGSIPAW